MKEGKVFLLQSKNLSGYSSSHRHREHSHQISGFIQLNQLVVSSYKSSLNKDFGNSLASSAIRKIRHHMRIVSNINCLVRKVIPLHKPDRILTIGATVYRKKDDRSFSVLHGNYCTIFLTMKNVGTRFVLKNEGPL